MDQLKSILHVVISLEIGGLERFVIDLINATTHNFKHIIVCLDKKGELAKYCNAVEILSLDLKPGLQFQAVLLIIGIIRSRKTDLVHTHNEKAQFYGALAGATARVPVVHTKHGKNCLNLRSRIRNNLVARLCERIVAVSHDAALQCIIDEKIPDRKVLTVLNGVDTEIFSPLLIPDASKPAIKNYHQVPVVGIVARLAIVKDHATLLAASRIIRDAGFDFRLLIVGDGPLRCELEAIAEALGVKDIVIFTGSRQDIPDLMREMDIFVLTSISEGISLTLIEAMAFELPIVATAVGGNPEVIIEGETGFLVRPQDPAALAEKIIILMQNEPLRRQLGMSGRKRAIEHFSLARAAEQYSVLYHSLLHKDDK